MRAGLVISLLVIFLVSSGLAAVMMSQQKDNKMVGPSVVEAEMEPEMEPEVEPEVEPEAEPEAETTSPATENYTYIKM
jgi:flagellar basal body-associated protein FliL